MNRLTLYTSYKILLFIVISSKPTLSITPYKANVDDLVAFDCLLTTDGNPPSNETEWRKARTNGIWMTTRERNITVPITSVLQEDNYTCNIINYPDIGRQSSLISNTEHLIVNGSFLIY